jgi:thiamine-phosphate pyrophosphorylase
VFSVAKKMENIKRIIDANINRLTEGLRVAEEYFRFVLENASVSGSLKDLRHRVRTIIPEEMKDMALFRDSVNDPGADQDEAGVTRACSKDVALANCKRAEEALRVLEEYLKLDYPDQAALFKKMRFELYSVEKTFYMQIEKLSQSRLYIIVTQALCSCPYEETIRQVLDNGADIIQLREKEMSSKDFLTRAEAVQKIIEKYNTLLVINDRPDIARICEADGIHVGQDDLPPQKVRSVFPSGFVGMSTHSVKRGQVT